MIMRPGAQRMPQYRRGPTTLCPRAGWCRPATRCMRRRTAWRPFEYGLRASLGQALVLLERRVVMTLVVSGERADQVEQGAAHQADD